MRTTRGLLALLVLGGCGTLFAADTRMVVLNSNPPGAQVTVNGMPMGTTPATLALANHRDHQVVFELDGRQSSCQLTTSVGAGYIVLDVVFGLLGVVVDAVTGEWKTLDQTQCYVTIPGAAGSPPAGGWDSRPGG